MIQDERRFAPAVREWSSVRRDRSQVERDRTRLARVLHAAGLGRVDIAEIVGVERAQVDDVLAGRSERP